ncbi:MAG: bile acid:sodium symporter family protein [Gammaproteobacteria bacterium]|nr:bile acid:sodium symporter family protein [Gammaproteobacteria bacterium]
MNILNRYFSLWAILSSMGAFFFSEIFLAASDAIVPLLAGVMFLMGLTLTKEDFKQVSKKPSPVFVGVILQFIIMPFIALLIANTLQLSNQLVIGMVLVGSCAGGTASNVMTYLARGDVALSISMTITSTMVGVVATPMLCNFYLSETVNVDTWGMLTTILQIVFCPVLLGVLLNHYQAKRIRKIEHVIPTLSMLIILGIITIVVALNSGSLASVGGLTLLAVILHNSFGLLGGFFLSRLLGLSLRQSHTIALEVGMQNSGLGVALAMQSFSATAALPGAIFSLWHNISGAFLASLWGRKRGMLE